MTILSIYGVKSVYKATHHLQYGGENALSSTLTAREQLLNVSYFGDGISVCVCKHVLYSRHN